MVPAAESSISTARLPASYVVVIVLTYEGPAVVPNPTNVCRSRASY
jgi:hypothetical protein